MKTHTRLILSILLAAVVLAIGLLLSPSGTGYASSPASLNLGKTVIGEGDDFATRALGQPWNMNGDPYPDFFTALKNIKRNQFSVLPSGAWKMVSENSDPRLWLHWTGVGTTQHILRMGDTRPIDASKYKLLSYYMCLDTAPSSQNGVDEDWAAMAYWMYDRSPNDHPANGYTTFTFFKQQGLFKQNGDCAVLTVDLSQPSAWAKGSWNNNPQMPMGLRLDPINKDNKTFTIAWVRLTTVDHTNTVPLTWSNAPAGEVKFYLSREACGVKGILVGKAANPTGSGTFQWGAQLQPGFSAAHPLPLPESFEPGNYHVYLQDINGDISCATATLKVHGAPILEFQSPSYLSGPDYASNVVNDPWGMANSADIAATGHVTGMTFNNGLLSAVTTGTDPRLTMNVGAPIDTNVYRFASFRVKIDGQNSNGNGWVQRFLWWYTFAGQDQVTTQDMMIYEGWHTYSVDLKTAGMENCSGSNCWSGFPNGFRFDPVEAPANTSFSLDFITLTGLESINRGSALQIRYTLVNAPGAEVTFYFDTDRNPNNGRVVAAEMVTTPDQGENPLNTFKIYLPVLNRPGGELSFFNNSTTFSAATATVPQNTYYVSADVYDGVMTTTWYSEVPVVIK